MGLCHVCFLSAFVRGIALFTLFACFVVMAVFLFRHFFLCVFVVGVCFCFLFFVFVLCVCVCVCLLVRLFVCLLCWFDGVRVRV